MFVARLVWAAAALVVLVRAQTDYITALEQLPTCIITCSVTNLAEAQCQLQNMRNCLCGNDTLQAQLSTCVQTSCNYTEQLMAASVLQNTVCNGIPQPSRSAELIRTSIALTVLTYSIVALRCYSQYTIAGRITADDWVAISCAIFMMPMSVIAIIFALKGFGRHFWDVPPDNVTLLRQLYYVTQILYVLVQNLAKISILLFYLRIFPDHRFRLATKITIAWVSSRAFSFLVAVTFQCTPIASVWNLDLPSHCINMEGLIFAGAGLSIFEDIVIILLPVSELKGLNLGLRKRITLVLTFAMGSFACITSIVRLKFIFAFGNSLDVTWDNIDVVIWSVIEVYTALMCACLISIRPLLIKYIPVLFQGSTQGNSNGNSSKGRKLRFSSRLQGKPVGWANRIELMSEEELVVGQIYHVPKD